MLKKRTMLGAACVLLSAVEILSSNAASGGIINLTVVEDKGLFQDIIQIDIFSKTSGVLIDPPLIVLIQRTNFEKFQIPIGLPYRLFNIYAATIEIPQPVDFQAFIDIYWLVAADIGDTGMIGGLPSLGELVSASMTGSSGAVFDAEITPINDLANLPTSSINDLMIEWDLSALTETTGNFFLAKVTLPGKELVPGPGSVAILALGGLMARRRRRCDRSTYV